MTVQHEGARPKRADDAYSDDAPTQVSMHSFPPKTIRRAPSTDQKRVRREMLRGKTANVNYCSACGLQFDPQEKRDRSEHDPNVCAECAGDNMDKNASLQTEAEVAYTGPVGPGNKSLTSQIYAMQDGDAKRISSPDGDHSHDVHYSEYVPDGDDGYPARDYKAGDYSVTQNCCGGGKTTNVHVSPFRAHETSQKGFQADAVAQRIIGHHINARKRASLQTEATQFDSTAERLNPGDHVRTPTGQTARVVRVRTHETSMGHVYVDTDQGTTVNKRTDPYQIVPHNSQQQEIPGYGVPGANSNKTPFGRDPHNQNERGNDTKCPVCNAVGTVKRQGDHYQCTRCGYQEKFGGAGGTTTTSPSIVKRFSTVNQKSAIARRAEQVVLDTEEQK